MLLYGIIISWESRDIQKEFNQSIMLSLSIGTILFIGAITIPFDFALFSDSTVGVVWFRMLSIYIYNYLFYSILNSDINWCINGNINYICTKIL